MSSLLLLQSSKTSSKSIPGARPTHWRREVAEEAAEEAAAEAAEEAAEEEAAEETAEVAIATIDTFEDVALQL